MAWFFRSLGETDHTDEPRKWISHTGYVTWFVVYKAVFSELAVEPKLSGSSSVRVVAAFWSDCYNNLAIHSKKLNLKKK